MKLIQLDYGVTPDHMREIGFEENDTIGYVKDGVFKIGRLQFIEDYQTLFPVQVVYDEYTWKTDDLSGCLVFGVVVTKMGICLNERGT